MLTAHDVLKRKKRRQPRAWNRFLQTVPMDTQAIQDALNRANSGAAVLKWDEDAHPRDQKGRFAEAGDWKKVGGQGGSNPGGIYQDPSGTRHYVKFPQRNPEQAQAEHVSDAIYRALGIPVKESQVVQSKGRTGLAGKMITAHEIGEEGVNESPDVKKGYVADAYLASWDVFGLTYDNIMHEPTSGRDYRIDNGGTLFFRAQGAPKAFPADRIDELESLIAPGRQGERAFEGLTHEAITQQAQHLVTTLTDAKLDQFIADAGITGARAQEYATALKGRRDYLARRYKVGSQKIEAVAVLKFNKNHDDRTGRFASGPGTGGSHAEADVHTLHGAGDALDSLLNGEQANIAPEDVRAFLKKASEQFEDPDLTNLHVEGHLIFGGNGLGITRDKMPQIPREHRDPLISELRAQGVTTKHQSVSPFDLAPTQSEISARRVGDKLKKYEERPDKKFPPLLVSKDGHVLDGHHHWGMMAAFALEHPDVKIPVVRLMVPTKRALEMLHAYADKHKIPRAALSEKRDDWGDEDPGWNLTAVAVLKAVQSSAA